MMNKTNCEGRPDFVPSLPDTSHRPISVQAVRKASLTRRRFLRGTALLAGGVTVLPRHVLGGARAPSERPALAAVGVGGVGFGQVQACERAGFQVVALCDVDDVYAAKAYKRWPQARRYRDYREMLEAEGDKIDAVYCGTPDHTHALISMAAVRRGKHTLTVKPLTHTIGEARKLAEAVRKADVMTQMTASPAWTESGCRTCEIIWAGVIGHVREAHIWSNRPLWPQGMQRPEGEDPIPKTFDWKLWLGPAPLRPFKNEWPKDALPLHQTPSGRARPAVYHPWNFRGWYDFGTGALGDMGCHHFNIPRRALKLGHPIAVSATSTRVMEESWPLASIVTWEFPAREDMPPVKVVWYDGGLKPPRPVELEPGRELPRDGMLYIGEKGTLLVEGTGGLPRLIPESKHQATRWPEPSLPRRKGIYDEWFDAVRGEPAPSEHWPEVAVPLTELVLLGDIAIRVRKRLEWDGANMRFTNHRQANAFIDPPYHNGWKL